MKSIRKICAVLILAAMLATVFAASAMAGTTYYTTANVNLRKGAGTEYGVKTTLSKGTKVEKLDSGYAKNGVKWYEVRVNSSLTGWCCASYLSESGGGSKGTITMKSGKSYIRTGPGLDYKVLSTIPKGASAKYYDTAYDDRSPAVLWYKIKYNGYTGWVSSKYTKGNDPKPSKDTVKATGGNTNIRKSPDKTSKDIGTLPKGAVAKYLDSAYDNRTPAVLWYKVNYSGKIGWVSSKYTKKY